MVSPKELPTDHQYDEASPDRARRRRWPWLVGMGLAVIVAGVLWVGASYLLRSHPGPESVSSAIREFGSPGARSTNEGLHYQPPLAGVYTLRGLGEERISFPPNSQQDGTTMPASVRYLAGGCWRWRVNYNTAHWEEYDFCPVGGELLLAGNRNSQSWDFGSVTVNNLAQFTCGPRKPVLTDTPRIGQHLRWQCVGSNTAVSGQSNASADVEVIGIESLHIGDRAVPTVRERQLTTLSGSQTGTVHEDWWFALDSGLPVRVTRDITIKSPSPIGTVTYTESGEWTMVSPSPIRPSGDSS